MKMILRLDENKASNEHSKDDYCCEKMKETFLSDNFGLCYERRYAETLCERRDGGCFWQWDYCPFCGKSIRNKFDEYQKVLKNELDINSYGDEFDWDQLDEKIPEEFKTDEWWKKRGM